MKKTDIFLYDNEFENTAPILFCTLQPAAWTGLYLASCILLTSLNLSTWMSKGRRQVEILKLFQKI